MAPNVTGARGRWHLRCAEVPREQGGGGGGGAELMLDSGKDFVCIRQASGSLRLRFGSHPAASGTGVSRWSVRLGHLVLSPGERHSNTAHPQVPQQLHPAASGSGRDRIRRPPAAGGIVSCSLWQWEGSHPAASGAELPSHPAAIGLPESSVNSGGVWRREWAGGGGTRSEGTRGGGSEGPMPPQGPRSANAVHSREFCPVYHLRPPASRPAVFPAPFGPARCLLSSRQPVPVVPPSGAGIGPARP